MHPSFRRAEDIDFFEIPHIWLKTDISVRRTYLRGPNADMIHLFAPIFIGHILRVFVHCKFDHCYLFNGFPKRPWERESKTSQGRKRCENAAKNIMTSTRAKASYLSISRREMVHEYGLTLKIYQLE